MKNSFDPFPVLQSKRLYLKKLDNIHAKAIYDYQSNKDNFPYVEMPVYDSIDDAKEYISKMNRGIKEGKWIIWAICLELTDEIIGTVSIWNLDSELNKAELGYGIFPAFRRRGYMAEALGAVVEFAIKNMHLDLVEAYTSHNKKPSIEFLQSMNFEYIETIEDEYSNGAMMDIFTFKKTHFN